MWPNRLCWYFNGNLQPLKRSLRILFVFLFFQQGDCCRGREMLFLNAKPSASPAGLASQLCACEESAVMGKLPEAPSHCLLLSRTCALGGRWESQCCDRRRLLEVHGNGAKTKAYPDANSILKSVHEGGHGMDGSWAIQLWPNHTSFTWGRKLTSHSCKLNRTWEITLLKKVGICIKC